MGGAFLSPESRTKVSTTNRNITASDNAVVISPNVSAGKKGLAVNGNYYKDTGNTTLGKGATITTNVSNGLSAEQLQGIVGDFGSTIRGVLTQAAITDSSTDPTDPTQAANDRAADQITNAPAQTAAEAKSYKWLIVGLFVLALVVGGFIKWKGKKS